MGVTIQVAGQNMTEGPVTHALTRADVVIACETDHKKIRTGMPGKKHYTPRRDPHQSISWNPDKLDVYRRGYIRFHRSGQAEGWPFPSPGRGMIYVKARLKDDPDTKLVLWGTWFLNSWQPMRHTSETAMRKRIVLDTTIPVVTKRLRYWTEHGFLTIGGGDTNSLRWPGWLGGTQNQIIDKGLERWYLGEHRTNRMRLVGVPRKGPKTGVGGQMQHESDLFTVRISR